MTDYNAITELETNPGAPGTSSLWKRWWKNPLAMFEGAVGAPGLWPRALIRPTAGGVNKVTATGGGGSVTITNASPPASLLLGSATMLGFGTMRLVTDGRFTGGSIGALEFRRIRAGVTTTLASLTLTSTNQVFTLDVTFRPLDIYSLYCRWGNFTSGSSVMTTMAFNICTAGEDLWLLDAVGIAAYFPILNNTAP